MSQPQPPPTPDDAVLVPDWEALLRDDAPPMEPPPELKQRIMEIVVAEDRQRGRPDAPDR